MNKILNLFLLTFFVITVTSCTKKTDTHSQTSDQNKPATNDADAAEITVGAVVSLTGSLASFGNSTKNGITLAMDELNAKGGALGKQYKLIALDDQSKPDEAATVITRLITQDKVTAVLGEVASSISLAMAPIAQSNKVPMISPSSTNPKVTQVGDYIFRVCFIDPFQGTVMAKFAFDTLKVKRVAILRDIKNDYSMGLANYFIKTFKELGGEIIVDQSYSEGDVDFNSQLTSIKAQNPEAVFVPGYYTEAGLIARQAKEMGLTVPLLGGDGWDSTKFVEIGGAAVNGSYFSNHYSPDDPSPQVQAFTASYKARFGETPDGMAVTAYDAMMILHDAIMRAGTANMTAIRDALATTKNYSGASGNITMNEARDAIKSAVVLQVTDGKFTFKEKVNP